MALIRCADCDQPVSTEASACPKCGRPVGVVVSAAAPSANRSLISQVLGKHTGLIVAIGAAAVLFGAFAWLTRPRDLKASPPIVAPPDTTAEDQRAQAEEKRAAEQALADKMNREDEVLAAEHNDLAAAKPARREQMVTWCVTNATQCSLRRLELMISAGANQAEKDRLQTLASATVMQNIAKNARDGDVVTAQVLAVAVKIQADGVKMLDVLPRTTLGEAAKDPDSARGSIVRTSGNVVEIRKASNGMFEGTLYTDDGAHFVRFVTPLSTEGVYANSWAAFRGVFCQEYDYTNVSGGQTRSLLLVGVFVK